MAEYNVNKTAEYSDDEIWERVRVFRAKEEKSETAGKVFTLSSVVLFVVLIVTAFSENVSAALITGLCLLITAIMAIVMKNLKNRTLFKLRCYLYEAMNPFIKSESLRILGEQDEDFDYSTMDEDIKNSGLVNGWNTFSAAAHGKGCFRGMDYQCANVVLRDVIAGDDESPGDDRLIFKGMWFILEPSYGCSDYGELEKITEGKVTACDVVNGKMHIAVSTEKLFTLLSGSDAADIKDAETLRQSVTEEFEYKADVLEAIRKIKR